MFFHSNHAVKSSPLIYTYFYILFAIKPRIPSHRCMTWLIKNTLLILIAIIAFMGISFNRVLLSWRIIELNLILFIPIMIFSKNFYFSNIMGLKYFLIQSLASILLLSIIILRLIFSEKILMRLFTFVALAWKIGIPPFHLWIINLMIDLNYHNFFIISTWQKVIPLYIIRRAPTNYLKIIIVISLIFSIIIRIDQLSVKKMLIISSIFIMAWVMAAVLFSSSFWMFVLWLYGIMLWLMTRGLFLLKSNNKIYILMLSNSLVEKVVLFMITLSMAGFPPLMGFFLKLRIIIALIFLKMNFISAAIIFSSVILMYMYTTVFFLSLSNYSPELTYLSTLNYLSSPLLYLGIGLLFLPLLLFF